jgi:signal transduction histidine kinase/CHASE3 domain sensor protein
MRIQSINISTLYTVILGLLLLISVTSYVSSNVMQQSTKEIVQKSIPINKAVQNVLLDLVNQETGIRGYVVSNDPVFLEPYLAGTSQLNDDLHKIESYSQLHPLAKDLYVDQLQPQIEIIQNHFREQIALVHANKMAEARQKIGDGKVLMDKFRAINDQILQHFTTEQSLVDSQQANKNSKMIIIAGAVLALVVAYFSFVLFKRARITEKALAKSEETHRHMVESLELLNGEIVKQHIEREETLIKLTEKEQELEGILAASHECILMSDTDGTILFANTQAKESFDFKHLHEFTIQGLCEHMRYRMENTFNLYEPIHKLFNEVRDDLTLQFRYASSKEEQKYYELYATEVGDEKSRKTHGFLFVFRDRTEEERVLQMKNELISIVSHELRTPLSSILGFVEILINRDIAVDKQKKYFQTIYDEAIRLSNLINDFLDLQRMESGQQQYHSTPVRMNQFLQAFIEEWSGKQDHRIQLHIPSSEVLIRVDEDRLRQVFNNLLSNAIKYSPHVDRIDIRLEVKQSKIYVHVQDYGLGIPEDVKFKIFNKFYRVDNSDRRQIGGTGLGLSICKDIVETHNGELTYTSVMGEGSVFTVVFPEYHIIDLSQKIVMVRNHDVIAQFIVKSLESLDLPVVHFDTVEECILALNECNFENRPLLCLIDLSVKGFVSGWNVLDKLNELSSTFVTPVIISSSLESYGNKSEYEIMTQLIETIDAEKITEIIQYVIHKEHQYTCFFPLQDESIVSLLVERGLSIKEATKLPTHMEIQLIPQSSI